MPLSLGVGRPTRLLLARSPGTEICGLDLNGSGTGIVNGAGTPITPGGFTSGDVYTVDNTAPTVSSVAVPGSATYHAGQSFDFVVTFGEAVNVDTWSGVPQLTIGIGRPPSRASYLSGSGTPNLTFRYTIPSGVGDAAGHYSRRHDHRQRRNDQGPCRQQRRPQNL